VINTKLPFVRELCLKYQNIDPVKELIPVRPVVHYMMGGVSTNIHGATPLAGLYAAGEVACVSINGANRLGSNSLPELLVFGARAGRAAAEFASAQNCQSGMRGAQQRRIFIQDHRDGDIGEQWRQWAFVGEGLAEHAFLQERQDFYGDSACEVDATVG